MMTVAIASILILVVNMIKELNSLTTCDLLKVGIGVLAIEIALVGLIRQQF